MSLTWRPLRTSDLPACIAMSAEPVSRLAGTENAAFRVLSSLLARNSLIGVAIIHSETREIHGFGSLVSIDDDLMMRVLNDESFCYLKALMCDNRIVQHTLTLAQQDVLHRPANLKHRIPESWNGRINPGAGINLVGAFSGWKSDDPSIKDKLGASLGAYLSGLNVKHYYKQVFIEQIAEGYAAHFGLDKHERPEGRYLVGLSREKWLRERVPAKPINQVFDVENATICFSPAERRVLQVFLEQPGLPQNLVAERLVVREIYSTMRSIKSRMGYTPLTEGKRGAQTWHEVIEKVRANPAEIRPWVVLPEQIG